MLSNKIEFLNLKIHRTPGTIFFIRNQNFVKQQNTFAGTGVLLKKKNKFYLTYMILRQTFLSVVDGTNVRWGKGFPPI